MTIEMPLRNRAGEIVGHTLVDEGTVPEGAWRLALTGYVVRVSGRRTIYLHRVLLRLAADDPRQGDHINRDPLDNRLCNLRIVTHAENCQNRVFGHGGSSFRGVSWHKDLKAWQAYGKHNGQQTYLGLFETELAAAVAAEAFRREHLPFAEPDARLIEIEPTPAISRRHRSANAEKRDCKRGHPLSGANLYINATSGARVCRACQQARKAVKR